MADHVPGTAWCRSCGEPIWWGRTESGKPIPVNARTDPGGNAVIVGASAKGDPVVRVLGKGATDDRPRYMPHWASCPDAKGWRR